LCFVKLAVSASTGEKFLVRSALNNSTSFKNQDLIRSLNSRQPMGNDKCRAAGCKRRKAIVDLTFTVAVEAAGCLIEDENSRVSQKCARYLNALPLATREPNPPLTDNRVVLTLESCHELIAVRGATGCDNLVASGMRSRKRYIVCYRAGEQKGLLQNNAELCAIFREPNGA
jgi:hypothetical protein